MPDSVTDADPFVAAVQAVTRTVRQNRQHVKTEAGAKLQLVLPVIRDILGFNPDNPNEVVPEHTADVGMKSGEKVDYALFGEGHQCAILVECKNVGSDLTAAHGQLFRYFGATAFRFGASTNGEEWRFHADLDSPNVMDSEPFLVFKLGDGNEVDASDIEVLRAFRKDGFDLERAIKAARLHKVRGLVKHTVRAEFENPSVEFIKSLFKDIRGKRLSRPPGAPEIVKTAINEVAHEIVGRKQPATAAAYHASAPIANSIRRPNADDVKTEAVKPLEWGLGSRRIAHVRTWRALLAGMVKECVTCDPLNAQVLKSNPKTKKHVLGNSVPKRTEEVAEGCHVNVHKNARSILKCCANVLDVTKYAGTETPYVKVKGGFVYKLMDDGEWRDDQGELF